MRIVNCGYDYKHDAKFEINRPNGSGDYMLLLLRSPTVHYLEGQFVKDSGNSVIIYKRGTPQLYRGEPELINDWVHFELLPSENAIFDELGIPLEKFIRIDGVHKLSSILRHMCEEAYSGSENSARSSALYLDLFLYKLSDLMTMLNSAGESTELYRKLSAIRENIYSNPQIIRSVTNIACEASVSLSYLQHKWREFFGVNIGYDITSSRIEYAKYLLFSTSYNINIVANMCGYESDVHFMRTFKKHTSQTPSQYRKENAKIR